MRAGLRKHRIVIEEPVEVKSDSGAITVEWVPKAVLWSTFEPVSASEQFTEQQRQDFFTVKFRVLYRDDITAKMRINFKGRIFDLVQKPIDHLGMQKELHLMGRERGE
ncbi:phage head closure protein [Methylophaga lonarensis]|uniref:phage head closure protein n=1 Tax=Methylophaga lonarensis TaxID=999151 RepID=UPI003D29A94E